jgi:TonB family protein
MPKTRPNPVALEAVVNVTGARSSGSSGSRDLFTEETKTVLVFKDGAVIGLTAAVSVGQLLFLTNKHSNQEVVCQVLHKRSFKPTMCYVELQFTEEKADFWAVSFTNQSAGGSELKAAEQVEAEETTEDDLGTPVAPHRAEDVDRLKREVEALREQLLALEKKNWAEAEAKAAAAEAAAKVAGSQTPAATESKAPEADLRVTNVKLELASVNDQSPEPVKVEAVVAPLMPTAKESGESARAVIGMALPNRKSGAPKWTEEKAKDPVEDLLPKPELDFSKVPQSAVHLDENDPNSIYKTIDPRREKVRIIVMSAFLVVLLVGGAWYGKWWQYLPVRKKADAVVAGNVVKPSGPLSAVPASVGKEEVKKREGQEPASQFKNGTVAPSVETAEVQKKESQDPLLQTKGRTPAAAGKKLVAAREKVAGKTATKEGGEAGVEVVVEPKTPEPVLIDAPVLPAKLLKAANPVYPPDAMLNYITGDVKAEVVVDETGQVGKVKIISGPKALRDAAVEALKRYEYAPATQGGKNVVWKTMVVVKFWYNP